MASNKINEMEAVSAASSNSGDVGEGVSQPIVCEICGKVCRNKAGRTLHMRKAHAETYHAENIPAVRVKARWEEDEAYQLARIEAELTVSGVQPRKLNSLLYELFPMRSQEAIKGHRRKSAHKDLVCTLVQELTKPANESEERERDHVVGAAPETHQERESGAEEPAEEYPAHLDDRGEESSCPEESNRPLPAAPSRAAWRQLALQDLARLVESLDEDPSEHLLSILELLRASEDSMEEIKQRMDEWMGTLFANPPGERENGEGGSNLRPARAGGRKIDCHKRGRPVRVKQRRLNPKRVARQNAYRRVQDFYKKNRKRCAELVLDQNCQPQAKGLPLDVQTKYWEEMFTRESCEDKRPTIAKVPNWNTVTFIAPAEVEAALKSSSENAAGPDGLTLAAVKRVNLKELTALLNIWLITGYVPTRLHKAETILIPKNTVADKPGDYRPITIASRLVRVYHKILSQRIVSNVPINQRQKAFVPVDGCSDNIFLLDALIRDSKRRLKPLCMVFVDISKAFDSVSHDTIIRAMRNHGLPEPLVEYVTFAYKHLETCLKIGRKRSDPILCKQGVRQGDPLSAILFNLVMDEVLENLDTHIGYKNADGLRISYLAFADDLILTAASPRGLQEQVDRLKGCLEKAGLHLNESKCATMRIDIDGKGKKWIANPGEFLNINGKPVTALNIVTTYRYLGLRTGASGSKMEVKETLGTGIQRLTQAPLKPQQRMFLLRVFLIPKLIHQLVLGEVTASTLESLDRTIRKAIREWLRLPKDTPKPFFHAPAREGGLGIQPLRSLVPVWRKQRLEKLSNSSDEAIRWVVTTPGYAMHVRKAKRLSQCKQKEFANTGDCMKEQAEQLHQTCDGKGLWQANSCPSINDWVFDGTSLLTGGDYIQAVHVRGNLLPTVERATRGRREVVPTCEAGCNAASTLAHISQSCTRTHRLRSGRHDSIVDYLNKSLTRNGFNVLVEPTIKTSKGNRKPDLVVSNGAECRIIDVTITADIFNMTGPYQQKVSYYCEDEILRWAAIQWPGRRISTNAVVMNWRGAMYGHSARLLKDLGMSQFDMRVLAVRVLTYTHSMFRHYSKSTTRG